MADEVMVAATGAALEAAAAVEQEAVGQLQEAVVAAVEQHDDDDNDAALEVARAETIAVEAARAEAIAEETAAAEAKQQQKAAVAQTVTAVSEREAARPNAVLLSAASLMRSTGCQSLGSLPSHKWNVTESDSGELQHDVAGSMGLTADEEHELRQLSQFYMGSVVELVGALIDRLCESRCHNPLQQTSKKRIFRDGIALRLLLHSALLDELSIGVVAQLAEFVCSNVRASLHNQLLCHRAAIVPMLISHVAAMAEDGNQAVAAQWAEVIEVVLRRFATASSVWSLVAAIGHAHKDGWQHGLFSELLVGISQAPSLLPSGTMVQADGMYSPTAWFDLCGADSGLLVTIDPQPLNEYTIALQLRLETLPVNGGLFGVCCVVVPGAEDSVCCFVDSKGMLLLQSASTPPQSTTWRAWRAKSAATLAPVKDGRLVAGKWTSLCVIHRRRALLADQISVFLDMMQVNPAGTVQSQMRRCVVTATIWLT